MKPLGLADALRDLVEFLVAEKVDYAVVGGLASSVRGEVRFTRDIDVAVSVSGDDQAERYLFQLRARGFAMVATVEQEATGRLATARTRHPDGVVCDFIFATCGIESEVIDSSDDIEIFPGLRVPTASTESLIAMKVLSTTPQRPRDLGDIQAMLSANPSLNEERVEGLLELIESRGYGRGQSLVEKWQAIRADFTESAK